MPTNQDNTDLSTGGIGTTGPSGSVVVAQYMERHMTFLPVTPREMRDLSLINTAAVSFSSAASFFLSAAIACKLGAVFADQSHISAEGQALRDFGFPAFLIVAGVFGLIAAFALFLRSRSIDEIRSETKEIKATVRLTAASEGS